MHLIFEALVLLFIFILYWINRGRRRYLKKRIGSKTFFNLYQTGRNFSFMLTRKELHLMGDTSFLRKGGVLYSFHFGVWELMPLTLKKLGYTLGIIVNRYRNSKKNFLTNIGDKLLYHIRSHNGIKIFYKEDTVKIVKFIKAGGLFGILVDGDTFYAKYEKAQKLARICNVPLVPFAAYRKNDSGILEINCNLANLVKKRPLDYLWVYKSREKRDALRQW